MGRPGDIGGESMKIRISISREYDTEEDYSDLSPDNLEAYLLSLFSEDIDNLVKYNETREAARVEVIS